MISMLFFEVCIYTNIPKFKKSLVSPKFGSESAEFSIIDKVVSFLANEFCFSNFWILTFWFVFSLLERFSGGERAVLRIYHICGPHGEQSMAQKIHSWASCWAISISTQLVVSIKAQLNLVNTAISWDISYRLKYYISPVLWWFYFSLFRLILKFNFSSTTI